MKAYLNYQEAQPLTPHTRAFPGGFYAVCQPNRQRDLITGVRPTPEEAISDLEKQAGETLTVELNQTARVKLGRDHY